MKICDTIKQRFQTMKTKLKKGDPIYIKVNADAMKGQKLTVVSDKGKYVVATAKDGRDYEIDKSAIRTKAATKPKVDPKSKATASKPKSKATASKPKSKATASKPKSKATASKPKPTTRAKATVCLPLFNKEYKKLSTKKYNELKKANKKNIEAGKITLRELQSKADKSAYKEYFG